MQLQQERLCKQSLRKPLQTTAKFPMRDCLVQSCRHGAAVQCRRITPVR